MHFKYYPYISQIIIKNDFICNNFVFEQVDLQNIKQQYSQTIIPNN